MAYETGAHPGSRWFGVDDAGVSSDLLGKLMRIFATLFLLLNVAYMAWMLLVGRVQKLDDLKPIPPDQSQFIQAQAKLVLVSERPAAPAPAAVDLPASPAADVVGVQEAPLAQVEPWCAVISGFASSDAAASALSAVRDLGGNGELRSEEVPVSSTWWVHLPPFPSAEAAQPILSELQAKQIDSYYVRSGELAGAISLGVFNRAEGAASAQEELNAKGYSPSIREIVRRESRSVVSVRLDDAKMRQATEWANLEANLQVAELQEIPCK